jgi:predicted GIY-YIG superfamily endonuclease
MSWDTKCPHHQREEIDAWMLTPPILPADDKPTALYRWFDKEALLLYIGISDELAERVKGHIKASSWMEFAAASTIERHPTRYAALDAEEAAIKAEHPLFNHQHNDTPEARKRTVEYLIKHDRLDLLAPSISRG